MSMIDIKNEKLSEALKKIRDLYPDDSLGDAIIMAVDRINKAEKKCEELNRTALEACERAHDFDKRYCDILVEKRKLENSLKGNVNTISGTCTMYMGYPVDPENPENCKVRLEELEK